MDFLDKLYHHGIKGQRWGVRRYRNKDGTLTSAGKERYMYMNRVKRAAKTKTDMDRLYNTLSKDDKKLLGGDSNSKEWLKFEEGEFVVKRFIKKHGNEPIAAMDIMSTERPDRLTVAIMTNPKYRGSGTASQLAKQGKDWFDKNADKYGAKSLRWDAYTRNGASRHIAEKTGFTYNKKASTDEWSVYDYKKKVRR